MKTVNLKKHIKGYIDLIRPFTLLAPIIVSLCIMMASFFYTDISENLMAIMMTTIIPASFSLAILNGASNALNQVTDTKSDKISKPYRPIVRGDVSPGEAKIISLVLYITDISLSLIVNVMINVFVLLIVVFAFTYSLPHIFKYILFLKKL